MTAQLYTTELKRRNRIIAATATMAAGAAPFLVVFAVIQLWASAPEYILGVLTLAAFVCAGLAPWYVHGTVALLGNYSLRSRLKTQVQQRTKVDLDALGAVFVGFSPGERLRVWGGETDRDVGFLYVRNDTLVYHGDEFDWSLPGKQIDSVQMAPPVSGLRRIIIHWHMPRHQSRALSLVCREANTIEGAAKATRRLYYTLHGWFSDASERKLPQGGLQLGYPPTDTSGSWAMDQTVRGSCLVILALGVIMGLTIWRISGEMARIGSYYLAILWAGLIAVVGTILTSYVLNYMHAWESSQPPPGGGRNRSA
ncbi:MAG: hypothetical protein ACLFWB_07405 [Armatimonadota bacterium]